MVPNWFQEKTMKGMFTSAARVLPQRGRLSRGGLPSDIHRVVNWWMFAALKEFHLP
jgi:hypothetical protein